MIVTICSVPFTLHNKDTVKNNGALKQLIQDTQPSQRNSASAVWLSICWLTGRAIHSALRTAAVVHT